MVPSSRARADPLCVSPRPSMAVTVPSGRRHRASRTAAGLQAAAGVAGHRVSGVASFGTGAQGAVHKPADGPLGGEQLLAAAGAVGDDDD